MEIPNLLEQHGPGDDPAFVAHENRQQREFLRLQIDEQPIARYLAPYNVDHQIGYLPDRFRLDVGRPARKRVYPRAEFENANGLTR